MFWRDKGHKIKIWQQRRKCSQGRCMYVCPSRFLHELLLAFLAVGSISTYSMALLARPTTKPIFGTRVHEVLYCRNVPLRTAPHTPGRCQPGPPLPCLPMFYHRIKGFMWRQMEVNRGEKKKSVDAWLLSQIPLC